MVPSGLRLFLAPVQAPKESRKLDFWREVGGFDYGPARDDCASRMVVASIEAKGILAAPQVYADLDLRTVDSAALRRTLLFPISKRGTIHGLAGWFEATLADGCTLETSPLRPATHWKQAYFPLRDGIRVIKGDHFEVTLAVGPEGPLSDNSIVHYDYRCTQLANERGAQAGGATARNAPCPCNSGKKFKRCCGASSAGA